MQGANRTPTRLLLQIARQREKEIRHPTAGEREDARRGQVTRDK
jgi:hypothetical protein